MLGYYEYRDEKSDKFWMLSKQGDSYETRWGKIGTEGQSMIHAAYDYDALCKKANEKIRKGYRQIEAYDGEIKILKPAVKAKSKAAASAVMDALEKLNPTLSAREKLAMASKAVASKKPKTSVHIETEGEKKGTEHYKATDSGGVELVHPSRCTADLPEDLTLEHLVAEPKMDGSRYVMYLGCSPYTPNQNALLSRRESAIDGKYVNKTDNVPHFFTDTISDLKGTVLDGEIQADDFLATNSIMNSSPRLAIEKQNTVGKVKYYVFDILYYCGTDVRTKPLSERRKIMEYVVTVMNNPDVKLIEQYTTTEKDFTKLFNEITSSGGEGLIIKDSRRAYGAGWSKMKKSYDISCVISGFKAGTGKYAAGVGSIALSVYDDSGELTEIGFASGFDDKMRADMAKYPNKYLNRVVDVFAQEIQDSKKSKSTVGRLRHPTFHRLRDDVNAEDCTAAKMWNDFKKVKSERAKKFAR